jgi:hypothetical protein
MSAYLPLNDCNQATRASLKGRVSADCVTDFGPGADRLQSQQERRFALVRQPRVVLAILSFASRLPMSSFSPLIRSGETK